MSQNAKLKCHQASNPNFFWYLQEWWWKKRGILFLNLASLSPISKKKRKKMARWTGLEPARVKPNWFRVKRLNHSAINAFMRNPVPNATDEPICQSRSSLIEQSELTLHPLDVRSAWTLRDDYDQCQWAWSVQNLSACCYFQSRRFAGSLTANVAEDIWRERTCSSLIVCRYFSTMLLLIK